MTFFGRFKPGVLLADEAADTANKTNAERRHSKAVKTTLEKIDGYIKKAALNGETYITISLNLSPAEDRAILDDLDTRGFGWSCSGARAYHISWSDLNAGIPQRYAEAMARKDSKND